MHSIIIDFWSYLMQEQFPFTPWLNNQYKFTTDENVWFMYSTGQKKCPN